MVFGGRCVVLSYLLCTKFAFVLGSLVHGTDRIDVRGVDRKIGLVDGIEGVGIICYIGRWSVGGGALGVAFCIKVDMN